MLRWLATAAILALLALDAFIPSTFLGRRGSEAAARAEAPAAVAAVGQRLPAFELRDLAGAPVRLTDLLGHRVLLTFERSLDW